MCMRKIIVIIAIFMIILVTACSKDMPYKSLSDTKLSTPTGNVVGVQKVPVKKVVEQKEIVEEVVKEETVVPESKGPSCKDSDYGKFTTGAGKVKGLLDDGSEYEESDKCVGDVLYEYYCDGDKAAVFTERCNRGCQNGFCV